MDKTEFIENSNEKEIKENLIRLIQSGDEANLELAIQLNIGQKLLDWRGIYCESKICEALGDVSEKWRGRKINISDSLLNRLYCSMFLFGKHSYSWRNAEPMKILKTITIC